MDEDDNGKFRLERVNALSNRGPYLRHQIYFHMFNEIGDVTVQSNIKFGPAKT